MGVGKELRLKRLKNLVWILNFLLSVLLNREVALSAMSLL